ncbi:MAG TPA: hypothetical protein VMF89_03630, partial [Polyangiales bacterium]|nr:hypothetical protein [Polyangiales bacterium]
AKACGVELRYLDFSVGGRSTRLLRQLNYHMDPARVRRALERLLDLDIVSFPPCALPDLASAMDRSRLEQVPAE